VVQKVTVAMTAVGSPEAVKIYQWVDHKLANKTVINWNFCS